MKAKSAGKPHRKEVSVPRRKVRAVTVGPSRATLVSLRPGTAVVLTPQVEGGKVSETFSARSVPAASIAGAGGSPPGSAPRQRPVPASKVHAGLQKASEQIRAMVADLASLLTEQYRITQIVLTLSFSAEGKFLGFGAGGAASVTVTIAPADLARPK